VTIGRAIGFGETARADDSISVVSLAGIAAASFLRLLSSSPNAAAATLSTMIANRTSSGFGVDMAPRYFTSQFMSHGRRLTPPSSCNLVLTFQPDKPNCRFGRKLRRMYESLPFNGPDPRHLSHGAGELFRRQTRAATLLDLAENVDAERRAEIAREIVALGEMALPALQRAAAGRRENAAALGRSLVRMLIPDE